MRKTLERLLFFFVFFPPLYIIGRFVAWWLRQEMRDDEEQAE